jgi:hypothetical protein
VWTGRKRLDRPLVELEWQVAYLELGRGQLDGPGLSIPSAGGFDPRAAHQSKGPIDDLNSQLDRLFSRELKKSLSTQ